MDQNVLTVLAAYHQRIASTAAIVQPPPTRHSGKTAGKAEPNPALYAAELETGRFINILARSRRAPCILELGTSYGYATLWLADAARAAGGRLTTMELHDDRAAYSRDMLEKAGLAAYVDFRVGNAVTLIADLPVNPDFVLIGLWKDLYVPCLDVVYPKLAAGAIVIARDMAATPDAAALRYLRAVRAKPHMTSVSVGVGAGLEISRYK